MKTICIIFYNGHAITYAKTEKKAKKYVKKLIKHDARFESCTTQVVIPMSHSKDLDMIVELEFDTHE